MGHADYYPHVSDEFAAVRLQTKIENAGEKTEIRIETEILSPDGKVVTQRKQRPHQSRAAV